MNIVRLVLNTKTVMQQDRIKPLHNNRNSLKQKGTVTVVTRAHGNASADIA